MDRLSELIASLVVALTPLDQELDRALADVAGALPPDEAKRWAEEAKAILAERRAEVDRRVEPLLSLLRTRLGLPTREEVADLRARVERLEREARG